MAKLTYMQKAQSESSKYREKGKYIAPVMPLGHRVPETTNEVISRILYGCGAISREQWEKVNKVKYDYDGDITDDTSSYTEVDDEFEQSRFAEYEPEFLEVPNVETKAVDVVPVKEQSQNQPQVATAEATVNENVSHAPTQKILDLNQMEVENAVQEHEAN